MSINFHDGFRDLNPVYRKQRKMRAVELANNWLGKIKINLHGKMSDEALKNFNKWLNDGNKLTFEEL